VGDLEAVRRRYAELVAERGSFGWSIRRFRNVNSLHLPTFRANGPVPHAVYGAHLVRGQRE